MGSSKAPVLSEPADSEGLANFAHQYGIAVGKLAKAVYALYERHQLFDNGLEPAVTIEWAHNVFLNIAASGRFSSDRSIGEYDSEIWKAAPYPVQ